MDKLVYYVVRGVYWGHNINELFMPAAKLIRDNIPQMISARGEKATTHTADDAEYEDRLREKLREEAAEYAVKPSVEELADVLEVLRAICEFKKIDWAELEAVRAKKFAERGGFAKRIILEKISKA